VLFLLVKTCWLKSAWTLKVFHTHTIFFSSFLAYQSKQFVVLIYWVPSVLACLSPRTCSCLAHVESVTSRYRELGWCNLSLCWDDDYVVTVSICCVDVPFISHSRSYFSWIVWSAS
jgi:hypothetical protein